MTVTLPAEAVLEVRNLTVSYRGGGIGVADVSFSLGQGQVVTLIGPNGAGKTSTLRGVAGVLRGDAARISRGTVLMAGDDVTACSPLERSRRGLAMVPEADKIFSTLSVAENLRIAQTLSGRRFGALRDAALELFPELREHLPRPAGYLSGGQRQMLGLAMAFCTGPQVLLVDELTLGLSPAIVPALVQALRQLASGGLPVVMAEQNAAVACELSNTICVLEAGRVRATGTVEDIVGAGEIAAAFLGRNAGKVKNEK